MRTPVFLVDEMLQINQFRWLGIQTQLTAFFWPYLCFKILSCHDFTGTLDACAAIKKLINVVVFIGFNIFLTFIIFFKFISYYCTFY
jgi:hypothetical protein